MQITSYNNAARVPFDLDGRIMHSSGTIEIIHIHLNRGESIAPHSNPFDVIAVLTEGNAKLLYNNATFALPLHSTAEIEAGAQRGFACDCENGCRLLIIKKLQ